MSEQNEKLTAEEMAAKFAELSKPELFKGAVHGIYGENAVSDLMRQYEDAANFASNYAAQQVEHATAEAKKETESVYNEWKERFDDTSTQLVAEKAKTAELREELEECDRDSQEFQRLATDRHAQILSLQSQVAELRKELEAWKSMHNAQMAEAKWLKSENLDKDGEIECLKTQLAEAQRQRDEAFKQRDDEVLNHENTRLSLSKVEQDMDNMREELEDKKDSPGWAAYNHAVTETGEANERIEELEKELDQERNRYLPLVEWWQSGARNYNTKPGDHLVSRIPEMVDELWEEIKELKKVKDNALEACSKLYEGISKVNKTILSTKQVLDEVIVDTNPFISGGGSLSSRIRARIVVLLKEIEGALLAN